MIFKPSFTKYFPTAISNSTFDWFFEPSVRNEVIQNKEGIGISMNDIGVYKV